MGIGKDGAVLRQLRTLFNVGAVRELTDGQLLERFATDRGEAAELAFAVLVERHGPMVLRVCRGVLVDPHDAQDAFQATFLVLVKKARGALGAGLAWAPGSIRSPTGPRRVPGRRPPAGAGTNGQRRCRSEEARVEADRRAGAGAPRGDRPAPRALPGAGGALRPRGTHPRAGGAASGLAGRDGQEPAVAGPGTAPRPAAPPRPRTRTPG